MKEILCFLGLFFPLILQSQKFVLPLYPEGIPCENNWEAEIKPHARIGQVISKVHTPELHVYLTDSAANGTSVVVCPGGGYSVLAWDWEGTTTAKWLNSLGVTAFVLKYRLPRWESDECRDKVALMDAKRAMRLVRSKASEMKLDSTKVGVMGFSAGGHLASTLSTHFDFGMAEPTLPIEQFSCRPDFAILISQWLDDSHSYPAP